VSFTSAGLLRAILTGSGPGWIVSECRRQITARRAATAGVIFVLPCAAIVA
jgi:hypothetical protein